MTLSPAAQRVWAKSGYDPERKRWLPLWLHLLDSAAVAEHLARHWVVPTIANLLGKEFADSASGLPPADEFRLLVSWLAGIHDIGKCTPAFSVQVPGLDDRMKEAGLNHATIDSMERRKVPHALAGHHIVENWLCDELGWEFESSQALASIVGAHHGIPPTSDMLNDLDGRIPLIGEDSWDSVRHELLDLVTQRTGAAPYLAHWSERTWSQAFLVELSGLVIVADWIASCEDYFPLMHLDDPGLGNLPPEAHAARAARGIARLEIPTPWRPHDDGDDAGALLSSRFNLPPGAQATGVQARAVEAARSMEVPGLLVVQESTGGGKTEAALMAAEILASRTGRSGVLFALPTQATTDAMFSREIDWLRRIEEAYSSDGAPSTFAVSLQHGRARLNKEASSLRRTGWQIHDRLLGGLGGDDGDTTVSSEVFSMPVPRGIGWDEDALRLVKGEATTASRQQADLAILSWFSGRKKSMLSDFVVTTVDHLLFGAMRAPHLALRHLGLSRKVVIVDEVHSYSTYMNVYLDRALTWLAAYGVPVVLLSATLSEARSAAMIDAYRRGLDLAAGTKPSKTPQPELISAPFPCVLTAGASGTRATPTSASGRSSTVHVKRLSKDADLALMLQDSLADGGCALVVRNTVRRAQETFEQLREVFSEDVSLHHARFTIGDRMRKDAELLRQFGPPRSDPKRPRRAIVVATQVIEQSLDVDFDLLITDLAPIDLILQRMGRLHRHERPRPPRLGAPTCHIDWLPESTSPEPCLEPGAKAIYGGQDLLLTAAALNEVLDGSGTISTPDDIHDLIEAVYGPSPRVPSAWQEAHTSADEAAERERATKRDAARGFLLEEPTLSSDEASLVGWLHTVARDDEERGRAQVRDGEDSLEVLLVDLCHVGGQEELRTLATAPETPGALIPTSAAPDRDVVRAMVMSAVRLPAGMTKGDNFDRAIEELEEHVVPPWQDDRDLRGQLVLPLVDGRAQLVGKTLEYTPETGLKEIHP